MIVSRHLGYYRTGNSTIRSADPQNPCLEPDMEWIGCTVCEIFAFKLYCDLETGVQVTQCHRKWHHEISRPRKPVQLYCDLETVVWGYSRSSKVALFDRAHTTLYSPSIVTNNYASIYYRFQDIAAYWSKIATPLYLAPPLGVIRQIYATTLGDEKLE